jgi:hypothetical protein
MRFTLAQTQFAVSPGMAPTPEPTQNVANARITRYFDPSTNTPLESTLQPTQVTIKLDPNLRAFYDQNGDGIVNTAPAWDTTQNAGGKPIDANDVVFPRVVAADIWSAAGWTLLAGRRYDQPSAAEASNVVIYCPLNIASDHRPQYVAVYLRAVPNAFRTEYSVSMWAGDLLNSSPAMAQGEVMRSNEPPALDLFADSYIPLEGPAPLPVVPNRVGRLHGVVKGSVFFSGWPTTHGATIEIDFDLNLEPDTIL